MMYKVFLVEDEIVAREGIRDNVDWQSAGFEFCGEAPDGEMALPLIEKIQPDVLITDIRMPFMDGLQLCKILRERMPGLKIIILSGHDEFQYAQEAVKLGVTEYLLKPIGVQDLHHVLGKIAVQLDHERVEQEKLRRLKSQIEDDLALRQEKFLLKLVTGGMSSPEAIQESQLLGLDLVAKWYLVMVVEFELCGGAEQFNYYEYEQVGQIISSLVENNPDIFLSRTGVEGLVLIIKGDSLEHLQQEGSFLKELIRTEVENKTNCSLRVGVGSFQDRISHIYPSFAEALTNLQQDVAERSRRINADSETGKAGLLDLDKSALENFLRYGVYDEFSNFFEAYIRPLSQAALQSYLVKNYLFVDLVLITAKFVHQIGGNVDQIIPEINKVETLLMNIKTLDQLKEEARQVFASVLAFRDSQAHYQRAALVHQAKAYIGSRYAHPDLSLNEVAAHVNLSPSHFSTVFSHETGETFKEYLTKLRIERAKELLRTTGLKSFEVAYRSGYNDPHYFSHIFRKNTGLSPQQFRLQPQSGKK
ncbi:MAG: response regulator [Anaerolineae bacterium]|nr:response regulator [Anaerolineae bacterium]